MSNYYLKLVIRLVLIFGTMLLLAWIFTDERLLFSKIILGSAIVIQIAEFIRFLRKSHFLLAQFVMSIRHKDLTQTFPKKSWGRPFDQLFQSMEETLKELRSDSYEKESRLQYLAMAFSTMDTGLITIEDKENVVLINERGKEILNLQDAGSMEAIRLVQPDFYEAVQSISHGGHVVIRVRTDKEEYDLSLNAVGLNMNNHHYLHITFRDIRAALDSREIEAWNRLTRILTHEIMNSVTPISSLSETMEMQLHRHEPGMDNELYEDLNIGLGTIRRRSDGLLDFVENYRKLSRVARPTIAAVDLSEVMDDQHKLWGPKLDNTQWNIELATKEVMADRSMLEQILINLIKNSLIALNNTPDPQLTIASDTTGEWIRVSVTDNGEGIGEAELKEIFVPFFTTRDEGTGIGLSLSKQMMHLHGGRISAESAPGEGTRITLWFPTNSESA